MAAVAVTSGTQVFENCGSVQMWTGDVTSVDDGDTFACVTNCGFGTVRNATFSATTAVLVVPSISGTTITFRVAAGSVAGRLSVWGK